MSQIARRAARPVPSTRFEADACSAVSVLVRRPLVLACLCAAAAGAQAQSAADDASRDALDPVVVTATRTPQRVSRAISDVTVFGREDIERKGSGSVADVLRGAAGVEIVRNGGPAGTTSCIVRGAESRFLAVLVDGVRMDSQSTGGASWESIPLSEVERIEIVRGGAGAIYGSDAVAGAVQIFTRKGSAGLSGSVAAGMGNHQLRKLEARVGGRSGDVDFAVGMSGERSGGFSVRTHPASFGYNPDDDGYNSRAGSLRVGWQLDSTQRLEAGVTAMHSNAQYDTSPVNDDHSFHNTSAAHLDWTAQWLPQWRSQVTLGQSQDQYKTRPSVYDTHTRLRTLSWLNTYTTDQHTWTATVERREDHLDNPAISDGSRGRAQNAIGLGDQWTLGAVALQAHVRHDQDSEFGGHATGVLGGAWSFAPGWRARASLSNSFRAPTLYQRFSGYGKADLKAEQGVNVEAGLNWTQQGDALGLTLYRNRVRDLINWVSGISGCDLGYSSVNPYGGCYGNVGLAVIQGVTLDGRTEIGPVRLSGSVDVLSPKNAETDKVLARRARRHASLQADTDVGAWTLGAQVLASGTRYDDAANTASKKLAGYAVLNVDAQWRFAPQWRLETRVDNVFDQGYETAQHYSTQPRQLYVGVRWTPR